VTTAKPTTKALAKAPTPEAVVKPALSRTASTKSDTKPAEPVKKAGVKPPTLKKEGSSIFKALAAKPRAAPKTEGSASEASAAPSPAPDGMQAVPSVYGVQEADDLSAEMKDASEDEQEDDFTGNALDADDAKSKAEASRKAKEEREETLRKMMDDDEGKSFAIEPQISSTLTLFQTKQWQTLHQKSALPPEAFHLSRPQTANRSFHKSLLHQSRKNSPLLQYPMVAVAVVVGS
jgi:hypothetical protein